jgi:hypothetical protein
MTIKCTKVFQGPPKFTQIGIYRLKIYHLATPVYSEKKLRFFDKFLTSRVFPSAGIVTRKNKKIREVGFLSVLPL